MLRRSLAIVVVAASALTFAPTAAAGGGCLWESARRTQAGSSAPEVNVNIAGCRYEPTTLFIQPGTTVRWLNKDPVPHTVTGSFLTLNGDALLQRGDSASVTFDQEGAYAYYCTLHPGMAASVIVGDPRPPAMKSEAFVGGGSGDASSQGPTADSSFPMAAGIAAIAIAGVAGGALVVRRRRRAMPVPSALR